MKFTTNKITWTDAMKEFATETVIKKLDRLVDNYLDINIRLSKLNNENLKVTLNLGEFRAQAVDYDFYTAITEAASKLKTIITKHKKKYNKSKEAGLPVIEEISTEIETSIEDLVSKEKVFNLEPINLETAIMEFEQTDYPFYVYKDIEVKNTITIVYKRFGDTYGLIRCY